jgi:hypothetical protein
MTMKRGDAALVQLRPLAEFKDFMRRLMAVSKAEIDQADATHPVHAQERRTHQRKRPLSEK